MLHPTENHQIRPILNVVLIKFDLMVTPNSLMESIMIISNIQLYVHYHVQSS